MTRIPVLVLCDDLWHPAEVIERGLASLPQEKYAFHVVKTAKDILTPARIAAYQLILCCKSDCVNLGNPAPWFEAGVTEVMPEDFATWVRGGGGFLAIHSGLAYREESCPAMIRLTGSAFLGHPPRCEVLFQPEQPGHPILRGVEPFTCRDEHYQIHMTCQEKPFLTSRSPSGGVQCAGYTRLMGEGRLCALTPGHTLDVWEHPMFQRLLMNAMAWCLKEDAPCGAC